MRKLLLPGLAIAALIIACENKAPTGPGGVGPGGVTVSLTTTTTTTSTTTTVPATSTISTTTTSVTGSASRRYITAGTPNVPSDMQLLFQLLTGTLAPSSLLEGLPIVGPVFATATEIRYKVTGTYVMLNGSLAGTTGTVNGDLFGPTDPLQNGGEFHGVLTATVGSCTAERVFRGPLGPFSMNLQGGEMVRDCAGSPLSFNAVTMTQSNAPPPPVSTTTSSTTSTTTTTTIPACSFTISPLAASVAATANTTPVTITASQPSCTWSAQALAGFLSVTPPTGAGSGSVQVSVAANTNGPSRVGTLLIAGQLVSIDQAAPIPPDLAPFTPTDDGEDIPCAIDFSSGRTFLNIITRNIGKGAATVPSFTNVLLTTGGQTMSDAVPTIDVGREDLSVFLLPDTCYTFDSAVGADVCRFTVTVDATNAVFESAETNNVYTNACVRFSGGLAAGAAVRGVRTLIPKR